MSGLFGADASCAYCGGPYDVDEHVVPISRGGKTEISNLVPACEPCNTRKRDRTALEWFLAQLGHTASPPKRPSFILCRWCGNPAKVGERGKLPTTCTPRCRKALYRSKRKKVAA